MLKIYEGDGNQCRDQEKIDEQLSQLRIIVEVESGEDKSGKKFNNKVAGRYSFSAVSTPSFKGKIAYQGNVVISPNGSLTVRTIGTGGNNGFISRKAPDADIQEASYTTTKDKSNDCPEYQVYLPRLFNTFFKASLITFSGASLPVQMVKAKAP